MTDPQPSRLSQTFQANVELAQTLCERLREREAHFSVLREHLDTRRARSLRKIREVVEGYVEGFRRWPTGTVSAEAMGREQREFSDLTTFVLTTLTPDTRGP